MAGVAAAVAEAAAEAEAVGPVGWLENLRGSVPAFHSAPSDQPSPSVSATFGFVPSFCS